MSDRPRAERLARAIASDISIYNQAKIQEALENDTLFAVLDDELEEGRKVFRAKHADLADGSNVFETAVVDIIIASRGHVNSRIF